MGIVKSYRLRLQRKRWRIRAFRKRRELEPVRNRTSQIKSGDIFLFSTMRNELVRLPYFLKYYRDMGVNHFFSWTTIAMMVASNILQSSPMSLSGIRKISTNARVMVLIGSIGCNCVMRMAIGA